jgi:hypothetical protein
MARCARFRLAAAQVLFDQPRQLTDVRHEQRTAVIPRGIQEQDPSSRLFQLHDRLLRRAGKIDGSPRPVRGANARIIQRGHHFAVDPGNLSNLMLAIHPRRALDKEEDVPSFGALVLRANENWKRHTSRADVRQTRHY